MTDASEHAVEPDTDEMAAEIDEFLVWLLDGCERAKLPRPAVERRFRYPHEFAKVIARIERRSPATGGVAVVVDGLAQGDAGANRLLSAVCLRYYRRPDVLAARRERAGRLQS
jgi:hypothetical protein